MMDDLGGVLCVDKPLGITSHDVVNRVRRVAGVRRVGHAGTLDPLATGVLLVAVGRATRLIEYVMGERKQYTAAIRAEDARRSRPRKSRPSCGTAARKARV